MTRGVTPASDVTDRTKIITNPGSTAAAGVVPGAWFRSLSADGQPGDSKAVVWECAASRSLPERVERCPLQGSGGIVCASGWCRMCDNNERADGYSICTVCWCGIDSHRSFDEVVRWSHATRAGARAACDNDLTAIADVYVVHVG